MIGVLATLIGVLGDFDLAEDVAQEAFPIATDHWPRNGVPTNPRAWLITTARNRATDRIRREGALATKAGQLVAAKRKIMAAGIPFRGRGDLVRRCADRATSRRS